MSYDGTLKFDTNIDTSGFQKGISSISKVASAGIKATATIITGAATAIVGLGTAAVKVGSEFEAQMSRVSAISGATGDDLEALKEQAMELGADTAFSALEAAEGMENLASAGFTTSEIMAAMPGMLDLAASSGEDLASSADIAASTLRGFGLEASDASHVADVLAKNAADTNAAVADTGEAMKYVAPVAHSMGLSLEEVAAAIGIMSDAGIKGSQAGTTLRSALTRLAKGGSAVQAVTDELGISFYDSEGKMKSLTEIVEMLQDSMAGLTDEQKQQYLITLFGQDSLSGMMALMDRGSDELAALTESYENCDGAAQEMAETMQNNLSSQIEQFGGSLESLGIAVYEDLKAPLTDTMKTINEFADSLLTAFNENGFEGLVSQFGTVLAELSQMAVEAVPDLVDTAVDLVEAFIDSIMDNSDEFAAAGAEMVASIVSGLLEVAGDLWSAGIELFRKLLEGLAGHSEEIGTAAADMVGKLGASISENAPLILQAGKDIIQGFFDGMSEQFPGVSALLDGFFEGFLDTAGGIVGNIVDLISDIFSAINEADPATMEAVGKALGTVVAAVAALNIAGSVGKSISELLKFFAPLKTGIQGITSTVGKVIEGFQLWKGGCGTLMEVISTQFPKIGKIITSVGKVVSTIGGVFTKIAGIASTVASKIHSFFSSVVGVISNVVSKVAGFISTYATTIAGIGAIIAGVALAVKSFADMFVNGFSAAKEALMLVGIALAAVGAVLLGAPALVAGVIAGIVAAVATLVIVVKEHWNEIVAVLQSALEKVGAVIDAVVGFFADMASRIWTWLTDIVSKLVQWGADMLATATEAVSNVIDTVVTFFSELPGKVWTWLTSVITKITQWASQMLSKATTAASNTISAVVSWFSQLPGKVWTWLTNTITKITQWASQMLSKATTAASNAVSAVANGFSQLPGKIWSHLSSALSKVASWASGLASKGASAASSLVNAVVNGVSSLPSKMVSVGKNIVSGVWKGIQNAASSFKSKVANFFSGIVSSVKSKLGIGSPSRVFAKEVGRWIPPGVGTGIEKAMPNLLRTTDEEMQQLASRMKAAVNTQIGDISVQSEAKATHSAETEAAGGDTYVEEKFEQNNTYNVPVASPSEVSKANREAARKLLGGVK